MNQQINSILDFNDDGEISKYETLNDNILNEKMYF